MARDYQKAVEVELSIKEMIKACHRFVRLLQNDTLSGGICKASLIKRLSHLERQLRGKRKNRLSDERLRAVGRQVASIVSEVCKSLISYVSPFLVKDHWPFVGASGS